MVDLSKVKVGDTVVFRNDREEVVKSLSWDYSPNFCCRINEEWYGGRGEWSGGIIDHDIVNMITKNTQQEDILYIEKYNGTYRCSVNPVITNVVYQGDVNSVIDKIILLRQVEGDYQNRVNQILKGD